MKFKVTFGMQYEIYCPKKRTNMTVTHTFALFAISLCLSVLQAETCNTDTTPSQPHRISNTHRSKNNTTNMVIQQNSRKLLMMDILMSETCWAHKKWNKIASDIKLVFYASTITMMHGPINIRFNCFLCLFVVTFHISIDLKNYIYIFFYFVPPKSCTSPNLLLAQPISSTWYSYFNAN
jgi:hypothetical protein